MGHRASWSAPRSGLHRAFGPWNLCQISGATRRRPFDPEKKYAALSKLLSVESNIIYQVQGKVGVGRFE